MAYSNRGSARTNLKDYKGAIADLDKLIELDPKNGEAHYLRGLSLIERGDRQGVILDLQKAADLYQQQGNQEAYQKVLQTLKSTSESK